MSSRLAGLIAGDLSGFRQEVDEQGRALFVREDGEAVFDVASRVEKRFLGRTEVAVFGVDLDLSFPEDGNVEMSHTGRVRRTGVTAKVAAGGDSVRRLASDLSSDRSVELALQPLDFTRFEVMLGRSSCRVELELMGASQVAIALPPIRSYVHLYPDQREAMIAGIEEVERVIQTFV
jgi:Protein of unknown function (DUF3156)